MRARVGRIIKYFVLADLALWAGWGFVSPILSVFVVEEIIGGTLVTVGISASLYWFARSAIQPPVATVLDRKKGEKDDFYALVFGLIMVSCAAFMLTVVDTPLELYIVQVVNGAAIGIYSVSWSAIFSRHLDKGRIAFEWSLDRATLGFAVAVTSLIGGGLASNFGFDTTFVVSGVLSLASAAIVLMVPRDLIIPRVKGAGGYPDIEREHGYQSSIH